ncbi:thermonuclease family protein [Clostridium cylindrosporum]|uniref:Thermonuclease NucH n=1 Tax=Clostridium cylindrosporum DSM 605 TaxID=1121307 RepID=A0A0J8DDK7_CLOCY|nr:thermonuclease family protein [Clostridium cylindrosporum]KMT22313.1 thermonuclease NucH [Clostridium cylindrosporum DSM 605]
MKKLKSLSVALSFMLVFTMSIIKADAATFTSTSAKVLSVYDGDTITVQLGKKQEKVRLIGVNTPELKPLQTYGKEAANYTKSKLTGKTVYLTYDVGQRDKYGRLLAYVWISKPTSDSAKEIRAKMFNANLLLNGYAQVMTVQPNSKYAKTFATFQSEAVKGKKGLWGKTSPAPSKSSTPSTSKLGDNSTVYYVPNGKSYHSTKSCTTLSRSKTIKSGKLKDVKRLGKSDPCNKCVK